MSQSQEATAIEPAAAMMLIEPAAEIEELKRHWQTIQELKKSILDRTDIQDIGGKTYVKRSGWRKLQSAFAISDRIISKEREDQGEGHFLWRIEVEAYHVKTGRSAIGLGACSTKERKFAHVEHDVIAIAHTRAKNRAISDLIGLGEVSAEELDGTPEPDSRIPRIQESPQAQAKPTLTVQREICRCGHARSIHLNDGKELYCMQCTREGKDVKCNLPLIGR